MTPKPVADYQSEACPERDSELAHPEPETPSEACPERPPYEKGMESVVCVLKAAASSASGISQAVLAARRGVNGACENASMLGEAAADLVREKAIERSRLRWMEKATAATLAVGTLDSAQRSFAFAADRVTAASFEAELALDELRQELRSAPEPPQPPTKRSRN